MAENKFELSPTEPKKLKLSEKRVVSHNVLILKFALPSPDDILVLPIGQHIKVSGPVDGKVLSRSYTPISCPVTTKGYFELMIKVYEQGKISKYMHSLNVGDEVEFKGPTGSFKYTPNQWKNIGMLAGGSGITPMLQVIRTILHDTEDKTILSLVFSNSTEDDVLLKEELDSIASRHPNRFSVTYTVSRPTGKEWKGKTGRINADMIKECLPGPSDTKVLLCGPYEFTKAMAQNLESLGYSKDSYFKF